MIPDFNPSQLREISAVLSSRKKIVILPHAKPDGDAMGASLGLYNYLLQKNHDVKVISATDYPDFLTWMEGNNKVIIYNEKNPEAQNTIKNADVIFCLDFNSSDRVEILEHYLLNSAAKKIMIDHHI